MYIGRERERGKKKEEIPSKMQMFYIRKPHVLQISATTRTKKTASIRSWMRASEWKSFMMAMTISRRLPHKVSICGGGYGYAKVTMAFNT